MVSSEPVAGFRQSPAGHKEQPAYADVEQIQHLVSFRRAAGDDVMSKLGEPSREPCSAVEEPASVPAQDNNRARLEALPDGLIAVATVYDFDAGGYGRSPRNRGQAA